MSEKFTPGPWEIKHGADTWRIAKGKERITGYAWTKTSRVINGEDANAALIAAAPDMYEALIAVLNQYETDGFIDIDKYENAEAALAKARGE